MRNGEEACQKEKNLKKISKARPLDRNLAHELVVPKAIAIEFCHELEKRINAIQIDWKGGRSTSLLVASTNWDSFVMTMN